LISLIKKVFDKEDKVKLQSVGGLRRIGRASVDNAKGCGDFVGQPINLR